jgi:hypothetical protein
VQSNDAAYQAQGAGPLLKTVQEVEMPAVDAVEDADGDGGLGAGRCPGQLLPSQVHGVASLPLGPLI